MNVVCSVKLLTVHKWWCLMLNSKVDVRGKGGEVKHVLIIQICILFIIWIEKKKKKKKNGHESPDQHFSPRTNKGDFFQHLHIPWWKWFLSTSTYLMVEVISFNIYISHGGSDFLQHLHISWWNCYDNWNSSSSHCLMTSGSDLLDSMLLYIQDEGLRRAQGECVYWTCYLSLYTEHAI